MRCDLSRPRRRIRAGLLGGATCTIALLASPLAAQSLAQRIENPVAVFSGLDKITATITSFEVPLDTTKVFGVLEVTPRACYTSPPTEPPKTTAFVEVIELRHNGAPTKIFTGWMFADTPGLSAVEHPVYDVWLTNCKTVPGSSTNE